MSDTSVNTNYSYTIDPECKYCKGTGWEWIMVAGEAERDVCTCVRQVPHES